MGTVQRFLEAISEYAGVLAAFLIIPMLVVIVFEVIMRYGFNAPTVWAFEATTLIYGMHFVLCFAYTHKHNGHVAIDVLESRLRKKFRIALRIIVNTVLFLPTTGLLAAWSVIYAGDSWGNWERASTSWAPPLYPFKTIMAIGMIMLFGQGLALLIRDCGEWKSLKKNPSEFEVE